MAWDQAVMTVMAELSHIYAGCSCEGQAGGTYKRKTTF